MSREKGIDKDNAIQSDSISHDSGKKEMNSKFTGPYSEYYDGFALSFLRARTSMGLSSAGMAEKLGVEKTRYSRLENGRVPATLDSLLPLLEASDLTPNEVFGYEDNSSDQTLQANEMAMVFKALPKESFDFIANVILHEIKNLKRPKTFAGKQLSIPEVFEILDSIRDEK